MWITYNRVCTNIWYRMTKTFFFEIHVHFFYLVKEENSTENGT